MFPSVYRVENGTDEEMLTGGGSLLDLRHVLWLRSKLRSEMVYAILLVLERFQNRSAGDLDRVFRIKGSGESCVLLVGGASC